MRRSLGLAACTAPQLLKCTSPPAPSSELAAIQQHQLCSWPDFSLLQIALAPSLSSGLTSSRTGAWAGRRPSLAKHLESYVHSLEPHWQLMCPGQGLHLSGSCLSLITKI